MGVFDTVGLSSSNTSHKPYKAADKTSGQKESIRSFVAEVPNAKYVLDSKGPRDVEQSELCREEPGGRRKCIQLALQSRALFSQMQNLGFYCALPFDPKHTEIICTPIPKS